MVLIEWTPALSVDIKSIDEQHKKLLGYMNTLYDALNQKKENDVLAQIFHDLEEYTHSHFGLEEEYFNRFNYPYQDAHVMQHKEFIRRLSEMKKQIQDDTEDVEDLLTFLVDWLTHHIKGTDHQYSPFFREHGVV
jgi:hemerythrin